MLIPTKLDLGSINAVPRTIRWLSTLKGISHAQLVGVVANHVRYHAGKLTAADLNSYNYLRQVVMSFTGNPELLLKSTILGHRNAVSEEKGLVASLNADGLALYSAFTQELRQRMQL